MESGHIDGIAPIWIAQHEVDDGEAIGCQITFYARSLWNVLREASFSLLHFRRSTSDKDLA